MRRADARNAALEERCATLEAERDESQEAAAAARERAEALLKSQRRMEWQNTVSENVGHRVSSRVRRMRYLARQAMAQRSPL